MKKIVLIALFALATLPGSVAAAVMMPNIEMAAPEMRIYDVLERAADELGMCFGQMCEGYEAGAVTVERIEGDTYRVTVIEGGGVLISELIDIG